MVMVVGAERGQGEKVKNNTETNRPGPEGNEDTRGSACCDCDKDKDKDKSSIAPGCACWLCCGMRVYGLQDAKIWKQCGQARGLR